MRNSTLSFDISFLCLALFQFASSGNSEANSNVRTFEVLCLNSEIRIRIHKHMQKGTLMLAWFYHVMSHASECILFRSKNNANLMLSIMSVICGFCFTVFVFSYRRRQAPKTISGENALCCMTLYKWGAEKIVSHENYVSHFRSHFSNRISTAKKLHFIVVYYMEKS